MPFFAEFLTFFCLFYKIEKKCFGQGNFSQKNIFVTIMYWTFLDPKSKLKVNISKHVFRVFLLRKNDNNIFHKNQKGPLLVWGPKFWTFFCKSKHPKKCHFHTFQNSEFSVGHKVFYKKMKIRALSSKLKGEQFFIQKLIKIFVLHIVFFVYFWNFTVLLKVKMLPLVV